MKYMIMLYGSQRDYDIMAGRATDGPSLTPADFAPMHEFMGVLHRDLAETGELVDAQGLTAPVHTRRIQLREGVVAVTDGPYAETQEVLAGYTVVECESFDRATEIAARFAQCPGPPGLWPDAVVDVRPVDSGAESEL